MLHKTMSESEAADVVTFELRQRHPQWPSQHVVNVTKTVLQDALINKSAETFDHPRGTEAPTYVDADLGAALERAERTEELARNALVAQSFTFGDDGTPPTPFVDELQIVSTDVPAAITFQIDQLKAAAQEMSTAMGDALKAPTAPAEEAPAAEMVDGAVVARRFYATKRR